MTQSSTIFSLNKDDLTAILMTLKPSLNEDQLLSLSVIDIRSQITEWLLLNGLSTMHSFVKNEADNEWKVPDKVDCISCGKYRVGAKGFSPPPVIMDQPLSSSQLFIFYEKDAICFPTQMSQNNSTSDITAPNDQTNGSTQHERGNASTTNNSIGIATTNVKSTNHNDILNLKSSKDSKQCFTSDEGCCGGLLLCLACKR